MTDVEIAVHEHRDALVGLAYRMLGTVTDAQDAVQEAFLRLERTGVADGADRVLRFLEGLNRQAADDLVLVTRQLTIGGRSFAVARGFLDDLAEPDQAGAIASLGRPLLVLHDRRRAGVVAADQSGTCSRVTVWLRRSS
jgi:hypothetical protein